MSSFPSNDHSPSASTSTAKGFWEDPCLVLERNLAARAQELGPQSGSQEPWQMQHLMGPLGGSPLNVNPC